MYCSTCFWITIANRDARLITVDPRLIFITCRMQGQKGLERRTRRCKRNLWKVGWSSRPSAHVVVFNLQKEHNHCCTDKRTRSQCDNSACAGRLSFATVLPLARRTLPDQNLGDAVGRTFVGRPRAGETGGRAVSTLFFVWKNGVFTPSVLSVGSPCRACQALLRFPDWASFEIKKTARKTSKLKKPDPWNHLLEDPDALALRNLILLQ